MRRRLFYTEAAPHVVLDPRVKPEDDDAWGLEDDDAWEQVERSPFQLTRRMAYA